MTQAPPQRVSPGGQEQTLPEQVWPVAQAWPQAPQLAGSLDVFAQDPLQFVIAAAQLRAQAPEEQTWPAAQAWPQLPQFCPSDWRLTPTPLQ